MGKAGFGGDKGAAVIEAFKAAGTDGATRADVAAVVGCTPQRVGEVLRAHGAYEKVEGSSKHYRLTGEGATAGRQARCEHERKAKKGLGTCTECAPAPAAAKTDATKAEG